MTGASRIHLKNQRGRESFIDVTMTPVPFNSSGGLQSLSAPRAPRGDHLTALRFVRLTVGHRSIDGSGLKPPQRRLVALR